jgi:hypothetical protein
MTGGVYTGSATDSLSDSECQRGGTGTLYITRTDATLVSAAIASSADAEISVYGPSTMESTIVLPEEIPTNGELYVNGPTKLSGQMFAETIINDLPVNTVGITSSSNALLLLNNNLTLSKNSKCKTQMPNSTDCSFVQFNDLSTLVIVTADGANAMKNINIEAQMFGMSGSSNISLAENQLTTFNVTTVTADVEDGSSIFFNYRFYMTAEGNVTLYGQLYFANVNITSNSDYLAANAYVNIIATAGTIETRYIRAANIRLRAESIVVSGDAKIYVPAMGTSIANCFLGYSVSNFTCVRHDSNYLGPIFGNGTVIMTASKSLKAEQSSNIYAATVLLCAPEIYIDIGALVTTQSRGCKANAGPGAGIYDDNLAISSVASGGGAGGGGDGGSGAGADLLGGSAYMSANNLVYSGSGGGCFTSIFNEDIGGGGGGVVSIMANKTLTMYGTVSTNGGTGFGRNSVACGGGSGGTIVLITPTVSGSGSFSTVGGGGGGANFTAGGGGGGGNTLFYQSRFLTAASYNSFGGFVYTSGGAAGTSLSTSLTPTATSGSHGLLPSCPAGYGTNNQSDGTSQGSICTECNPTSNLGTYKVGISSGQCLPCGNKRGHSSYVACGYKDGGNFGDLNQCPTTSNCPYVCAAGEITAQCLNPFLSVIFALGSWACTATQAKNTDLVCIWGGFSVDFVVTILGILMLLKMYRYRENQKYFLEMSKERKNALLGQHATDAWLSSQLSTESLHSPLFLHDSRSSSSAAPSSNARRTMFHYMKASAKNPKELRLAMRMADADMPYHACRIYLQGSNHPDISKGIIHVVLVHCIFRYNNVFKSVQVAAGTSIESGQLV